MSTTEQLAEAPPESVADLDARVEDAIDLIRPALQADGGDIILRGIEDGVVTVELAGACGGCPLSTDTMKAGVERIIRDKVPEVSDVVAL